MAAEPVVRLQDHAAYFRGGRADGELWLKARDHVVDTLGLLTDDFEVVDITNFGEMRGVEIALVENVDDGETWDFEHFRLVFVVGRTGCGLVGGCGCHDDFDPANGMTPWGLIASRHDYQRALDHHRQHRRDCLMEVADREPPIESPRPRLRLIHGDA